MKEGDLLKIQGETGEWYAELVGIDEDDQLEVFYINRSKENRWVWEYDDDCRSYLKLFIGTHTSRQEQPPGIVQNLGI